LLTLTASGITYGDTLSSSSLNGSVATNGYDLDADGNEAVAGTFAFADSTIAPNGGTTNVWVIFTPSDSTNYTTASNTVSVTVSPAAVTLDLLSSAATNGYLGSVFFTATNLPLGATSNVVFAANSVPFSTNNVANGGTTSVSLSSLPRGTNLITASYAGDANYLGTNASLNQIVTNHPPVASAIALGALSGTPVTLAVIGGKYAPTDMDGDALTISAVQNPSSAGGAVSTDGTNITYTALSSFSGTETFTYTVIDGYGGSATATVTASVASNGAGYNKISDPVSIGGGLSTITYAGIPGYRYALDTTPSVALPITWTPVVTNTANSTNGLLKFTFSTSSGSGYFRTRYVP
jgi:hypothetical protein